MSTSDPENLHRLFAERANAGDIDGLLALYEDGAAFVGPDGVHATGIAAIRGRLESLLALSPHITPIEVGHAGGRPRHHTRLGRHHAHDAPDRQKDDQGD